MLDLQKLKSPIKYTKTPFLLLLLLAFIITIPIFFSCEHPVPKDVMFCKSQEVYVLEIPFDKKSAIIVIYKGDEVRLLGDTTYKQIDSVKFDRSDFYVKVVAKRGVEGWVHKNELQKERIKVNPNIKRSKPEDLVLKKKLLDSLEADSISKITFGSYSANLENKLTVNLQIDTLENQKRAFKLLIDGLDQCKKELKGELSLENKQMTFQDGDCKIVFLFYGNQLELQESGNCAGKDCLITSKLKRKID